MEFTFGTTLYPPDTVLKAYPASNWPTDTYTPEGAPVGEADDEAKSNGEAVTFLDVKVNQRYFAVGEGYAGSNVYHGFWAIPDLRWNEPSMFAQELADKQTAHAAATKAHGIDSSKLLSKPESPSAYTQTFSSAGRTHAEAELATNLPTNLNVITTLLGTLVGEVNATNKRINEVAKALNEQKKLANGIIDDLQAVGLIK